jgi:hypothetical protein
MPHAGSRKPIGTYYRPRSMPLAPSIARHRDESCIVIGIWFDYRLDAHYGYGARLFRRSKQRVIERPAANDFARG